MSAKMVVAHDFVCPWCWIGLSQVVRLRDAFEIEVEWVGYELYPEGLDFPDLSSKAKSEVDSDRPKIPSRLELAYAAEGMVPPKIQPPYPMRTHKAHNAVEYAKSEGVADPLVERLYRAYWQGGIEIERLDALLMLGRGLIRDEQAYRQAIEEKQFADRVIAFDEEAYAVGVYNVPTFFIGGERYAEQPYSVLFEAASKAFSPRVSSDLYSFITFPPAHNDRPYTYANMVSSIDGRAVMDSRTHSVAGLGSAVDRELMRRLYRPADAIMIGAGTLRAEKRLSYPPEILRVVVTGTGNIDPSHNFFSGSARRPIVVTAEEAVLPEGLEAEVLRCGRSELDLLDALRQLRSRYGVQVLHLHGGPRLLGSLFEIDLVDELFLTVAPKIRLGSELPTFADAPALPTDRLLEMELVSAKPIENELFLRYRRKRNV